MGEDKTPSLPGPPLARLKGQHLHARIIWLRGWRGRGAQAGGAAVNTESRPRMNQGDPGLRDISGRAWWMQNGRRRGWRDQAAQEAGTRLKLGREQ